MKYVLIIVLLVKFPLANKLGMFPVWISLSSVDTALIIDSRKTINYEINRFYGFCTVNRKDRTLLSLLARRKLNPFSR